MVLRRIWAGTPARVLYRLSKEKSCHAGGYGATMSFFETMRILFIDGDTRSQVAANVNDDLGAGAR